VYPHAPACMMSFVMIIFIFSFELRGRGKKTWVIAIFLPLNYIIAEASRDNK